MSKFVLLGNPLDKIAHGGARRITAYCNNEVVAIKTVEKK